MRKAEKPQEKALVNGILDGKDPRTSAERACEGIMLVVLDTF